MTLETAVDDGASDWRGMMEGPCPKMTRFIPR